MSAAQRRFFNEIATLIDSQVTVTTTDGKSYTGTLVGISPETMSLCLSEAIDGGGKKLHKVVLSGNVIATVFTVEKPFDLKALSERLEKVFPTMVKLYESKGFIWVMEKIKVTEKGVVEGTGPAAERVLKVYNLFRSESKT